MSTSASSASSDNRGPWDNSVTIIIPAYNEAATLPRVLDCVRAVMPDAEIIVVDDASTDGTGDVARAWMSRNPRDAHLLAHSINRGKGAALRTGFRAATRGIVVVQDADFEYCPDELPALIEPIVSGDADVVFGSRFMGEGPHRVHLFWHYLGNRVLTLLSNAFTNLNLTDMETGHKAFRRSLLERISLNEDRFGFEPEITAKVARAGARIYEVGVSYRGRSYAEGKKIGWKDGVRALYCIARYRLLD